jgi:hypothetical protein
MGISGIHKLVTYEILSEQKCNSCAHIILTDVKLCVAWQERRNLLIYQL